ncbi:uncharacterized protein LOC111132751 isoform X2 [Crassostrea virginica]
MSDINAISKISERKRIHEQFKLLLDSSQDILTFNNDVSAATKESTECIQDVGKYANRIIKDLGELGQLIKDFTIQIGEKIKTSAEAGLIKDVTHTSGREKFDMERGRQIEDLQKLAVRQLDIQKVLCETEGLIMKVEQEGFVAKADIDNIYGHLNKWINGLETEEERKSRLQKEEERKRKDEEEKKMREKEEAERKAEEQRKKEEEEKKRREEEEAKRKAEEQRKREEEQKKKEEEDRNRRNSNNWPTYLYEREKSSLFHSGICCVVSAITGSQGLEKDDIVCTGSDSHIDLENYPKNKDEILISSLIQIKSKSEAVISLELPMKVFVPKAPSEINQEVVFKVSVNGGKWKALHSKEEQPRISIAEVNFVATDINNFSSLDIVVVSRPKRENMIVKATGVSFEPTGDRNVRYIFPPGCFKNDTNVQFKVDKDLANRAKADKQFNGIKIATSLHGVEFEDENILDIDMEIYPDLHKIKNVSVHQKTVEKCKNKLVTDISVLRIATRLRNDGKIQDKCLGEIKSKMTEGMRARRLLEEFNNCDEDQFNALTDALEKENQGHLAKLLKKTMDEIKEETEANTGSDFIGDIYNTELQIVTSCQSGEWEVMKKQTLKDFPDGVVISLTQKCGKFDIMGLIVHKDMSNQTICRIAEALYRLSYQVNAKLMVRQNGEDPTDCLLRCVENNKVPDAAEEMKKQGFPKGPPDSPDFGICDGEEILIKITGNLIIDSDSKEKRLKFYLNMNSACTALKLDVYNKKAQTSDKAFSGELEYNVGPLPDQGPPRRGSIILHIPKDDDLLRFAPLTLDISVKVSAKYLAWRLPSKEKPTLDEFFLSLVDKSSTKCRILKQRGAKEATTGTTKEICELFIKNWANQRPKNENKVNTLTTKLREFSIEFAEEFSLFMKPFSLTNGILSNNGIEELSKHVHNKWEVLAQKLGFDEMDIDAIKFDCKDDVRRAVQMFDKWRLSDFAIEKGKDILSYLADSMDKSNCSQTCLNLIKTQK